MPYSDEHLRYLRLLSQKYQTVAAAASEIIRIEALLRLPKGTEHFMSDLHGEDEAFAHIFNNALRRHPGKDRHGLRPHHARRGTRRSGNPDLLSRAKDCPSVKARRKATWTTGIGVTLLRLIGAVPVRVLQVHPRPRCASCLPAELRLHHRRAASRRL